MNVLSLNALFTSTKEVLYVARSIWIYLHYSTGASRFVNSRPRSRINNNRVANTYAVLLRHVFLIVLLLLLQLISWLTLNIFCLHNVRIFKRFGN